MTFVTDKAAIVWSLDACEEQSALDRVKKLQGNFAPPHLIILAMRVFLVILMMVLLPLRAGLGDVMAMERVGQHTPAADTHSAARHDCHEVQRHDAASPTDPHASAAVSDDGTQAEHECSDCTVCHTAALPTLLPSPGLARADGAPPQAQVLTHVNADPAPSLKPPIA